VAAWSLIRHQKNCVSAHIVLGKDMRVKGSCLCKRVQYELDLPFDSFVHCHCSRCRKASGTAHATTEVVRPQAFRWIAGERDLLRYDLPEARSFATSFCRHCGAPMPHATRSGREVIVPAGSLDDDPGCQPDRHVEFASRASWFSFRNDLPIDD